jgi:RimJ/RimL family protein N-acetyltransferase
MLKAHRPGRPAPEMDFSVQTQSIRTAGLALDYFLVPWDSAIIGQPVAQIGNVKIVDPAGAPQDFATFEQWLSAEQIALCACRLSGDQLVESMFLEERGFRFIELNYQPTLTGLQNLRLEDQNVVVEPATGQDREILTTMAGKVFQHGRFHQDPRVGAELGNRRYGIWMKNAFEHPAQKILKCMIDGAIVGFFVVEFPRTEHCFWSLVGLAPGLQGTGLGKRVWRAMLRWHQAAGVGTVSTSISSHNVAVFNLYVSLGFRFPAPSMTLQWVSAERHWTPSP